MCNKACMEFGKNHLKEEDVRGKSIIEVGSLDTNGSLRPIADTFGPRSYIGVDIQMGRGVDFICDAYDLLNRFGVGQFDAIISTEVLEHVRDWRKVINNFKHVLNPNGVLLFTTRSRGFPFHGYPFDFWRYEISDIQVIFSDFIIEAIEKDYLSPGIFVKVRKPLIFNENDLSDYKLYSVIKAKRSVTVTDNDITWFKVRYAIPHFLRQKASSLKQGIGL